MTGNQADRELLIESLAVHLGFMSRQTLVGLAEARRDDPAGLGTGRSASSWSMARS